MTAEESKADVIMDFPFMPALVDATAQDFDTVVRKIKAKDFKIVTLPDKTSAKNATSEVTVLAKGRSSTLI